MMLLSLCAVLLAVGLHEVGHVLGGLSQGFRFVFLAVGPLWVEQRREGLSVSFNRVGAAWGGLAVCVPPDGRDVARRMAVIALAGPLSSLVLAGGALGLAALFAPVSSGAALTRFGLLILGMVSLCVFIATAFLPGSGGYRSDGHRARALLRGDSAAERESALLALSGLTLAGQRPRDWPVQLVEQSALLRDAGPLEAVGALTAAQSLHDRGDAEAAGRELDRALALIGELPSFAQPGVAATAAWFEAAERGALESARDWLARSEGPMVDAHVLLLAQASVALLAGDRAAAAALATQGLAEVPKARFGASAADSERLQRVLDQAASA
jgi:hypothetical protein